MSSGLGWHWHRLRAMSPFEVLKRLRVRARTAAWSRRSNWTSPPPALPGREGWVMPGLSDVAASERTALILEAEQYAQGRYRWLGRSFHDPGPSWHRDASSGRVVEPRFAGAYDLRDPTAVGDVKLIWELSRHHHLTMLALAYRLTDDDRFGREVLRQLRDWVRSNPIMVGINWASAFELATRLISWAWIERLLRGTPEHADLFGAGGRLWNQVYWHQRIVDQRRSFGSSANDHLIGEMAGLYIASSVWPVFPRSDRWRESARRALEREVRLQVFPDGLNREQAFGYHLSTLEFFLLAGLEGQRSGQPFSDAYARSVRAMIEAIPRLRDAGGNLPRWGDDDEGMAVQLRARDTSRVDWLLRSGEVWPGVRTVDPKPEEGAVAARLATAGLDRSVGSAAGPASDTTGAVLSADAFRDAGVYVLSARRGDPVAEVFCTVDAGSLGYLSIAAHAHADALSFTVSVSGLPFLIDPGTYTYHLEPDWRAYFRGTASHNTITLDRQDQSVSAGPFLWRRHARSRVLQWDVGPDRAALVAEHDGYVRLKGPGVHRRRWTLVDRRLEIIDQVEGHGTRSVEWRAHFAPECQVRLEGPSCVAERSGARLQMVLDEALDWRLARGESDAGWYSPGFNRRIPTTTLIGRATANLPMELRTELTAVPRAGQGVVEPAARSSSAG